MSPYPTMEEEQQAQLPSGGPDEVRPWFDALAHQDPAARQPALDSLSRRSPQVARKVLRLLEAHDRRGHFLSSPVTLPLDPAPEPPVEFVGPYKVVKTLSQGGMGVVYEAVRTDDVFKKRVALKMIRTSLLTRELKDRFRVERQILAAMEHPNVARILDGGETRDGRPYLVMEFVEGSPIDQHARQNNLGLDARLALFLQVCGAAQFAHRHLVVHRDLKPANIFVTSEGQVKLLDFGIAKILSHQPDLGLEAQTTMLQAMTPDYASPEQITRQAISTSADLFLLGIVLYELVADVHPYRIGAAKPPHEVLRAICEEDPPPPSSVASSSWKRRLKGDFDKIVAMAMQKQPDRRYPSAEALAADIRRFMANEPVLAQGDSARYRAYKFLRRRWPLVAATAAVFAALATAAIISTQAANEARQQRLLAEQAAAQARAERATAEARREEAERLRIIADNERARSQRNMEAQRALAMNLLTTSDTQFRAGSFKDAIANLQDNIKAQSALAAADPADTNLQTMIGVLEVRLCGMRAASGDPQRALAECKSAIGHLEPFASSNDPLVRSSLGAGYATYGKLKTNPKEAAEAVRYGRKAVQAFEELLAKDSGNTVYQRSVALSQGYLAQGLFYLGERQESVAVFGKAVASLGAVLKSNPADRTLLLTFASMLVQQSDTLRKAGEQTSARDAMRHALSLFQSLAESPGATDLEMNEYANWLVRSEFTDLRRPETALRFAQRIVRNSDEKNPGFLDTLAWAHYRLGDAATAIEVQRKALKAIEGNAIFLAAPALKRELEDGLKTFEAAAAQKK
ncbi:MAG: protein kinase [Acidobacteria bacterium]|nr:protein kinase [Acidobacteriota bacterium]